MGPRGLRRVPAGGPAARRWYLVPLAGPGSAPGAPSTIGALMRVPDRIRRWAGPLGRGWDLLVLVGLCVGPFLVSARGRIAADSKQYLYLDPDRFLAKVPYLWDPSVAAGTVPHQQLGYLWPMGPWFWAFEHLGAPDWVAQRLWLGAITLAAGAGVRWMLRGMGLERWPALVGALVYALAPYQLAFTARASVLLLPWAALGWMVALAGRAARRGGWRDPALLALLLGTVGGVNAASLVLLLPAPALAAFAAVGLRGDGARRALAALGRISVLGTATSLWWLAGLRIQGAYGMPVLELTENLDTVSAASAPGEVLRGLGNWFLYGSDRLGPAVVQSGAYADDRLTVAATVALPVAALAAALALRWRGRALFAIFVALGTVLAVGAWPTGSPSAYGRVFGHLVDAGALGRALRNTPRAVPIVLLGIAGLLAGAVRAFDERRRVAAGVAVIGVTVLALRPVWDHGWLSDPVERPEEIPAYWHEVAGDLDRGDHDTRVWEVPGSNFAAYRWGNAIEPVTPGLTDRPYLSREVLPYGSPATANLLDAVDRRMQEGTFEPASLAPIARMLGVGEVVLRTDLDNARYANPDPAGLWPLLLADGAGLAGPVAYGPRRAGVPAVARFAVPDPEPIVRTAPLAGSVLVDGDGDGLVDAAAAGLLDGHALVLPTGSLDDAQLVAEADAGSALVVTDTNRKRIQTWFYALSGTRGPTERPGETVPEPSGYDVRLDPYGAAGDPGRTTVRQVGAQVSASSGGSAARPEDRAASALDGDPETAWRVGGADPTGARWSATFEAPVAVGGLTLTQPRNGPRDRVLTEVAVRVDDGAPVRVRLGAESLSATGQRVDLRSRPARRVEIEILSTSTPPFDAARSNAVGLSEVGLAGVQVSETVVLPTDALDRLGPRSASLSLDLVMTRLRTEGSDPGRQDDEALLDRTFSVPSARAFALTGTVREAVAPGAPLPTLAPTPGECREDLVRLDGRPVAVRLTAPPGVGAGEGPDAPPGRRPGGTGGAAGGIALCQRDLRIAAGTHRLEVTDGRATGVDVDRLVLSSSASGGSQAVAARGSAAGAPVARLVDQGRTAVTAAVEATDRRSEEGADAFWLVLGQSENRGWSAEADGAVVGPRTLVDGFANGWLIRPEEPGPLEVKLRWGPQRLEWAALSASAVAVALALAGLVRRRRAPGDDAQRWLDARVPLWRTAAAATRPAPGVIAALAPAVVAGVVTASVARPWMGVIAALGAAVERRARGWIVVLAGSAGCLVASRLADSPELAWLAIGLLIADLAARSSLAVAVRPRPGPAEGS